MGFDELLARADQTVEGPELNRALFEAKQEIGAGAAGYEIVVDDRSFEDFLRVDLPRLTEHLLAKRLPMLGAPTLLVTIWRNGLAHIIRSDRLFEVLRNVLDLSKEHLRSRIRAARVEIGLEADPWGQAPEERLLLPGPEH